MQHKFHFSRPRHFCNAYAVRARELKDDARRRDQRDRSLMDHWMKKRDREMEYQQMCEEKGLDPEGLLCPTKKATRKPTSEELAALVSLRTTGCQFQGITGPGITVKPQILTAVKDEDAVFVTRDAFSSSWKRMTSNCRTGEARNVEEMALARDFNRIREGKLNPAQQAERLKKRTEQQIAEMKGLTNNTKKMSALALEDDCNPRTKILPIYRKKKLFHCKLVMHRTKRKCVCLAAHARHWIFSCVFP